MSQRCIWCGSSNMKLYRSILGNRLYCCQVCELVQTEEHAQKNRRQINNDMYSEEYLENYLRREELIKERFNKRVREIESISKGGVILDVGCSVGFFLETLRDVGTYFWKLYGIDMNRASISVADCRINAQIKLGKVIDAKYKSNFFDCITCFDVLEHDRDIRKTLGEISRILKPKGLLVVQSPNYKSVMATFSGENWDWWSIPDHTTHFCQKTITKVLNESGFSIISLVTWEDEEDFVLNIAGNIRKSFPTIFQIHRICAKVSLWVLPFLWRFIKMIELYFPIGGEILVYARKK